jgi:4,5-DOPA dioxygenase extradiol
MEDHDMGLDHGAWTVLKFIWPEADVPVFEMSMDYSKDAAFHFR